MIDSIRTRNYLKELSAILIKSEVIIQKTIVDSKVCIYKKETYRKRNGKTCYVEVNRTWFPLDWKRTTTYHNRKGITINDYNSFSYTEENIVLDKDYQEELITLFKLTHRIS